ncbi:hypothetical protein [Pedobacter sp. NJ-S-72]
MKYCQDCGAILRGRTDKKFCDDHCRGHFNNAANRDRDINFKQINRILKKNTGILEKLVQQGVKTTTFHLLSASGFNFCFSTHQLDEQNGEICICCYNYGYKKK